MKIKQWFLNLFKQEIFKQKEPEIYQVKVVMHTIKTGNDAYTFITDRYYLVKVIKVLSGSAVKENDLLEKNEYLRGNYGHSRKINEVYTLNNPFESGWSIAP
jgi:hypothetical protein